MNNRLLRFLCLMLQILVIGACLAVCVYGILISEELPDSYHYIAVTARIVILLLLTLSYYKTSMSSFDPGNVFMILALLFLSVTELNILPYFSALTGWGIIPPRVSVRLQLFSQFMSYFSVAGFGLYYQNSEQVNTSGFSIMGTLGILFLSLMIPATQDIDGVWGLLAPRITLGVIAATTFIVLFIVMFNEQSKSGIMRFLGLIFMMAGNLVNVVLGSEFFFFAVGSGIFVFGGFILLLATLRNSVIL